MRLRLIALSLMLLAAACGGTDSAATSAAPATPTASSEAPATTPTAGATDAPATTGGANDATTATSAAPTFDGPPAPNFTTTLSDGSQFELAAHGKPLYLVFWAEW